MVGIRFLLGVALLAGIVSLLAVFFRPSQEAPAVSPITLASPAPAVDFSVLLVHEQEGVRQVLACTKQRCTPQPPPAAYDRQAVFDGEGWLYYQETESELSKITKKILTRTIAATGTTAQLMEATPLTLPRELIISPTGKHTAFWLDNVDRPEEKLTELWLYDREKNGVRVAAEKLYRPDIVSRPRWNHAGNLLWFLADTGAQDNPAEVLGLVVVPLSTPVAVAFPDIAWGQLRHIVDTGTMDIAASGTALAYAAPRPFGREELGIVSADQKLERLSVRGRVVYLQFLEDESLLYAVQDARGVTVWRRKERVARHIARQSGRLLAAQGVPSGEHVLLALEAGEKQVSLMLLHTPTGSTAPPMAVAAMSGSFHLTQLQLRPAPADTAVEGTRSRLDDAELVAFVDRHFPRISGVPGQRAHRLVVTDQPNSVYVDYESRAGKEERILLVVQDVTHADWSIKGRYQVQRGEWRKVQGGGLPDPKPARLYEWEEAVGQWILKDSIK